MNFFYIILLILFIAACFYYAYTFYNNYMEEQNKKKFIENGEFLKNKNIVKSELYYFYTDWCPHCKTSMKIWKEIKIDNDFKQFKINFFDINCEDKSNKIIVKDFKIKEYPTIVLLLNDKKYIYDANLNKETLKKFILAVYEKQ